MSHLHRLHAGSGGEKPPRPDRSDAHGVLLSVLVFPSLALFGSLGWAAAIGYAGAVAVCLWFIRSYLIPALAPYVNARSSCWVLVLVMLVLSAAHLYIHPLIDTAGFRVAHVTVGPSDGDDAIDDALQRLLSGRFPYGVLTFLGQPITPMPGALVMALPFHLLGATAMQNVFWLAVLAALFAWVHGARSAMWMTLLALGLSPVILYHVLQGMDYIANGIYVLVSLYGVAWLAERGRLRGTFAAAVVFGVALSSRLNFLLLVPLLLFPVYRERGAWFAGAVSLGTATGFLGVTLPFYLYDPSGFTPLHTVGIAPGIPGVPYSQLMAPAAAGLCALAYGWTATRISAERMVRDAFLVQAMVVVLAFALTATQPQGVQLRYAHFAVLAMFFGLWSYGAIWLRDVPGAVAIERTEGTSG